MEDGHGIHLKSEVKLTYCSAGTDSCCWSKASELPTAQTTAHNQSTFTAGYKPSVMSRPSSESEYDSPYGQPAPDSPSGLPHNFHPCMIPLQPGRGSCVTSDGTPITDLQHGDGDRLPVAQARRLPAGNGQDAIPGVSADHREGRPGNQPGQQRQPGGTSTGNTCALTAAPRDGRPSEPVQQAVQQPGGACAWDINNLPRAPHAGKMRPVQQAFVEAVSISQHAQMRPGIQMMSGVSQRFAAAYCANIQKQHTQRPGSDQNSLSTETTGQKRSRDEVQESFSAQANQQAGTGEQPGAQNHGQPGSGSMHRVARARARAIQQLGVGGITPAQDVQNDQDPSDADLDSRGSSPRVSTALVPDRFRGRPPRVYFPLEVRSTPLRPIKVRPPVLTQPEAQGASTRQPGLVIGQPGLVSRIPRASPIQPAARALIGEHPTPQAQQPVAIAMQMAAPGPSGGHPRVPADQLPASSFKPAASGRPTGHPECAARQHRPGSNPDNPSYGLLAPRPTGNSPQLNDAQQHPIVGGMEHQWLTVTSAPTGPHQVPTLASPVHPPPAGAIDPNQSPVLIHAIHPQFARSTDPRKDPITAGNVHPPRASAIGPTQLPIVAGNVRTRPASATGQRQSPIQAETTPAARDRTVGHQAAPAGAVRATVGAAGKQTGVSCSQPGNQQRKFSDNEQLTVAAGHLGVEAGKQATSGVIQITANATANAQIGPGNSWGAAIPAAQAGKSGTKAGKPGAQAGALGVLASKACAQAGKMVAKAGRKRIQAGKSGGQAGKTGTQIGRTGAQTGVIGTQTGIVGAQMGVTGTPADNMNAQAGATMIDMSKLAAIVAGNMGVNRQGESVGQVLYNVSTPEKILGRSDKTLDLNSIWDNNMKSQNVIVVKFLLEPDEDKELGLSSFCGQGGTAFLPCSVGFCRNTLPLCYPRCSQAVRS